MTETGRFLAGWDDGRVSTVLAHYESQTDEEAVAEEEAASEEPGDTAMTIPIDLVPAVRELIGRHRG